MVRIEKIDPDAKEEALGLALRVFMEFEAPDYEMEGIQSFRSFIGDPAKTDGLAVYGAFEGRELVGMGATRNGGTHIALLFVDPAYHRKGIGKALVQAMCDFGHSSPMTVNSSPYAVEIYKRMGFHPTDTEQISEGIRYTPMRLG